MRPFDHGAGDFFMNGRAAPNIKSIAEALTPPTHIVNRKKMVPNKLMIWLVATTTFWIKKMRFAFSVFSCAPN